MRGKRFSEEQIIGVIKEADAGMTTKELCRRHGVRYRTFGMDSPTFPVSCSWQRPRQLGWRCSTRGGGEE